MSDGGVGSSEAHEEAPPGGGVRSGVRKMPKFNMRVFNGISRSVPLIPLGVRTTYSSRGLYPYSSRGPYHLFLSGSVPLIPLGDCTPSPSTLILNP